MTFVARDGTPDLDAPRGSSPWAPEPMRIRDVHRETASSFTWTLDASRRAGGFSFAPGQFNMLYLFGVGEVAISVSGDPARSDRIVHTIRSVGTVTRAMERLRKNDVLGLRGPFGAPWPLDEARGGDLLLVAGGLGLAPLRPALYHALRHRDDYGQVVLLYGARSPEDLLYPRELAAWQRRSDLQSLVTVDHADRSWKHHVGVVPALLRLARFDPKKTLALVCGPEVMMRFAVRELELRGITDDPIHLSMERNMRCAVGFCGHCQLGPAFLCKDGPVLRFDRLRPLFSIRHM